MPFESPERILLQRDKLNKILSNFYPIYPVTVDIEPSYACNHGCIWCAYKNLHSKKYIPLSQIDSILGFCIEKEVKWIIISGGGEPTMHPDFIHIINKIEASKLNYTLYTNGSKLSQLAGQFSTHCKYIRVSLDACTAPTYSKVHGVKQHAFHEILRSIKYLTTSTEIYIGLSFVISSYNSHEIIGFVNLANDIGVNEVLLRPDINDKDINLTTIGDKIEKLRKTISINIVNRISINDTNSNNFRCYASEMKMVVNADGYIPICCIRRDGNHLVGNIGDDDIESLWNSTRRRDILSSIDTAKCPPCRFNIANSLVDKFILGKELIDQI